MQYKKSNLRQCFRSRSLSPQYNVYTVSSYCLSKKSSLLYFGCLFSTLLSQLNLVFWADQHAHYTWFLPQTSQEGNECTMTSMAIRIVEFSNEWYKIRNIFPKKQLTQRKLLNFEFWINGKLSKSAKTWLSKSIFYVKNHPNLSHFFSLKNTNLGAHLLLLTFFDNVNF